MDYSQVPPYDKFFEPAFLALKELGGSATVEELNRKAFEVMKLSDDQLAVVHKGNQSKAEYRMAWARTYLKKYGLFTNTDRGVWAITTKGNSIENIDSKAVTEAVRATFPKKQKHDSIAENPNEQEDPVDFDTTISSPNWETEVLNELLNLSPSGFEKFSQFLLRESGFIEVNVTGKTGDGGIDGNGIIRFAGLVSFPVVFQCKRYSGSVTAEHIRNFRGAMQGRAEKGLVITTGTFTPPAYKEATRDGAPVIDLVDGDLLVKKIKELRLGLNVEMVERVTVNHEWFASTFGNGNLVK